jgi:hypothetical protein
MSIATKITKQYMRYVDFVFQTLMIITGIVVLVLTYLDPNWPAAIFWIQLILGPWQVMSSLISIISESFSNKEKKLYLILSSCYLLGVYISFNSTLAFFSGTMLTVLLTLPAWTLAFYYYFITWKYTFPRKRKRGSFLPNLGF